jgi:sarcosine oxidase subunit gamma
MHDPRLQSPLHGFGLPALARPADSSCGVWANEIPHQGYISLRGDTRDNAFVRAAAKALVAELPVRPCTFTQHGATTVLWLSPDEWMIVCPRMDHAPLLSGLGTAMKGIRSQVVDNAGGFTEIALLGPHAADALSHATVYHVGELEAGRVVGTTFGKSSLYLRREGEGYRLLLRRSFADYIWRYLERAALPYGFGVAIHETAPAEAEMEAGDPP